MSPPPPSFADGELVTYYPQQSHEADNTHFEVRVLGTTRSGRVRIEGASVAGVFKKTVSPKRLIRQALIET